MAYLLDTNHASAIFIRHPRLARAGRPPVEDELFLPLPALGKLWFMVHNSRQVAANEAELRAFLKRVSLVLFDEPAAEEFGRVRAELRKKGKPIPQIDAQIAAIARVHAMVLLTDDDHFQVVDLLKTENWLR